MNEEKLEFEKIKPKLRETDFLKRCAEYKTECEQLNGVEQECKKFGKDVRDTFHVVGTTSDGDTRYLHIVASGEEGIESARKTLMDVAEAKNVEIADKTTKRYDVEKDEKELQEVSRALMDWFGPKIESKSQQKSKSLKEGD